MVDIFGFRPHSVNGKELFDKIVEKGQYSEKDAAKIVNQIVSAVEYLHGNGIAHRDLKPENLLSAGDDDAEVIKIADFGFSKNFGEEKLMTSCGSPGYVGTCAVCVCAFRARYPNLCVRHMSTYLRVFTPTSGPVCIDPASPHHERPPPHPPDATRSS